jgi:hypothetical protein
MMPTQAAIRKKGGGMKRLVLSLAVVGTALALAAGMALAQASTDTFNVKVPIDEVFPNSCTDEPVRLTGKLHILFHITEDAKGGFHVQFHAQPQGVSGTGLESGTQYRGVGVTRDGAYFPPGELRQFTFVNRFHLVSKGPSENLLLNETIHVTFNAKGEPTAEVARFAIKCAG